MKNWNRQSGSVAIAVRLLAAFVLLFVALGANADDFDEYCFSLFAKSGATPGTPSCATKVAAGTSLGMGSYACPSQARIDQWCNATAQATEPEQSCPVADPVYPGSGAVTLSQADFVSGDDIPLLFTRTYRSKSLGGSTTAMGPAWVHNWQRSLGLANASSGAASKVVAYRGNGEPVTFNWAAGTWRTAGFTGLGLTQNGSGWPSPISRRKPSNRTPRRACCNRKARRRALFVR